MTRRVVLVLLVVGAVVAGLVVVLQAGPGAVVVTVGADGAMAERNGVRVVAPPGSAPPGAELSVAAASDNAPGDVSGLRVGATGDGVRIELGGRQPDRPIAVVLPSDAPPPDTVPVVVTRRSTDGAALLLPATYDPATGTVSARTTHLSSFWPALVSIGDFVDRVGEAATGASERPDCPAVEGAAVQVPDERVFACLRLDDGGYIVEITNNSPSAWKAVTDPDADLRPQGSTDPVSIAAIVVGRRLYDGERGNPTVLPVRGTVAYRFDGLPGTVGLTADPGAYLISNLFLAADVLGSVTGRGAAALDGLRKAECIGALADYGTADEGAFRVESTYRVATSCFDLGGFAVGLLVPGLLALNGSVSGIADTLSGPLTVRAAPDLSAFAGRWSGTVLQPDAARGPTYTAALTIAGDDQAVGTIAYPELGCSGDLRTASVRDGRLSVTENLTVVDRCLDAGRVTLVREGDRLRYAWSRQDGSTPLVTGILDRTTGG